MRTSVLTAALTIALASAVIPARAEDAAKVVTLPSAKYCDPSVLLEVEAGEKPPLQSPELLAKTSSGAPLLLPKNYKCTPDGKIVTRRRDNAPVLASFGGGFPAPRSGPQEDETLPAGPSTQVGPSVFVGPMPAGTQPAELVPVARVPQTRVTHVLRSGEASGVQPVLTRDTPILTAPPHFVRAAREAEPPTRELAVAAKKKGPPPTPPPLAGEAPISLNPTATPTPLPTSTPTPTRAPTRSSRIEAATPVVIAGEPAATPAPARVAAPATQAWAPALVAAASTPIPAPPVAPPLLVAAPAASAAVPANGPLVLAPPIPAGPEVAIILSGGRFFPDRILLQEGRKTRLVFTTVNQRPAALIIEKVNVQRWIASDNTKPPKNDRWEANREIAKNRMTEITLDPALGSYNFHDAITGAAGEIIVDK